MATSTTTVNALERDLLDAARDGDQDAYRRLVEPHRGALHAHCYRMLGSVQDAEDALQDALLRAWRGLSRFEGRSSLRSWLYRIATNASLNAIERRPRRVLAIDHRPPPRPHHPPGALAPPPPGAARRSPRPAGGAARRVDLGRALSRRAAGARRRPRGPRGALRAPRGRRAGLRGGAAAPAAQPARGPHPARGAGLLGAGDRRGARDDGGGG